MNTYLINLNSNLADKKSVAIVLQMLQISKLLDIKEYYLFEIL